ncbi:universal stress protein [Brevibacterium sp. 50QC2O2]|jgi:nucleotide-binding universal stress UspA family protein|uniref:universal stress protein n=1 Tax=Brevibacterium TaxID=1696 RepID=UPI00211C9C41|nr:MULTISPECIES: universal stress protein [unclassified Brevibacterium]MCQ9369104.1 universal stress protein [Brevibacterium sp. 91QC2O2]MCQ9385080.1 universal stress protein [Brevibacterium sp. 68QC2CO]MCQ9387778.1 universal stress protein [Brevibacterium sp. 50QC2O2]
MSDQKTPEVADAQAVVVGIDGSDSSNNALSWAIEYAQATDRSIRLVGAYTVPSVAAASIDVSYVPIDDSAVRAAVTDTLKEAAGRVKQAGVQVEAVIEIGDAAGVLVEESKQATLAVVGTRGRGGFAGRLLGSVPSALPAHAKCPTVVIPTAFSTDSKREAQPTASRPIRNAAGDDFSVRAAGDIDLPVEDAAGLDFGGSVVVGIDALGKESPALWAAAEYAVTRGLPLHILGVITTTVVGPEWLPSTTDLSEFVGKGSDKLKLAQAAVNEKYADLKVDWTLFDGQPSEVLVRASDTADLLVLGSRGRGGFAGLLLGSTSQSVLPYAKCPTMVVRVAGEKLFK